ncbi:unnamed protein product [Rotaria sp. Silwood2]|nr:unnamed protein product [Rotaria sp. Silwood2]CAF3055190.1 unnamed protein product [Rotaria sp. Silwood2]CAF3318632.1 unnamed protein product [Rotaria sp. Silwood2]CAF3330482.1 unnamed protein product [Rotaria sp. Silwood2]CAF4107265.1 unnamed protein product [Rotaria sp. Silwood2]
MTLNHPSSVRDFIRVNFGPICTSAGIQLSNMIRGKGTGAGTNEILFSSNIYDSSTVPLADDYVLQHFFTLFW